MRLMRSNKLTRPNRFYRGIAIFFLLFTVFDLASAWPCQEDGLENFSAAQQTDPAFRSVTFIESPSSDQPDHQPNSGLEEHDCFCCCTHVAPVEVVRITNLNVLAAAIPWNLINLPTAPIQGTDHPPRLA